MDSVEANSPKALASRFERRQLSGKIVSLWKDTDPGIPEVEGNKLGHIPRT